MTKNNEILCTAFGDCMVLYCSDGDLWCLAHMASTEASIMEDSFRTDLQCLAVWGERPFPIVLMDGIA